MRDFIRICTLIFGILGTILLFYGLYMTPYFSGFGASNQGEIGMGLLFILVFLGILLGLYGSYRHSKGKYLSKYLP